MTRGLPIWPVLAGLLAACADSVEPPADLAAPAEPLVWPEPPAKPRIKYLHGFREPAHLGIGRPFFEQFWAVFAGEKNREMTRPYAIAVDGERLAIADPGLPAVHLFDTEGKDYERIVQAGQSVLRSPVGVAFGGDRLYVADSVLGQVFVFDAGGDFVEAIGGLERPTGLAYDQDRGRLYVAETLAHRISVFDEAGARLFAFGGRGTAGGEFNYPTHLFLRPGRLYVNDTMNFRLQTFDLEGNQVSSFGRHGDGSGDFAQPKGVGVDSQGHVYVADSVFDRVQIFDTEGRFLLAFGGPGNEVGRFWLPAGLFIAEDRIYVADSYNRRVQVFQFLGGG